MLRQAIVNSSNQSTLPPPAVFHRPLDPALKKEKENTAHAPVTWDNYFEVEKRVAIPGTENVFQVYFGRATPLPGPLFVLLHGCGLSAMSWALVAAAIKPDFNVVAFDMRGHGSTTTSDDADLSADTLTDDTVRLLDALYGVDPPEMVLVGHSMGGAVATRTAASGRVRHVAGLAVVDVVEGSALAALSSMRHIIASRPASFPSVLKAIEWAVSSETVRNLDSARVSVPAQLTQRHEDARWVWRTDLASTEAHWKGWFTDLSKLFMGVRAAKLLLLAGTDRLDRDLTVGQMQGKFQLTVLPAVGHLVQEDAPAATAAALTTFAKRNQFGKPLVFPKPFSDPPKPQIV